SPQAYFCQNPDGRIFFAIPYEDDFTLVGTTDADHQGPLDNITATPDEIAYICKSARAYFKQDMTPADVIWSYAGVRPLVDDGSGKPETASRGYHFDVDTDDTGGAPMLSVFGGKITTYRHLAESAIGKLSAFLPILSGPGWTLGKPLPGGSFPLDGRAAVGASLQADYPFIDPRLTQRLVRSYGLLARIWLTDAKQLADLGAHFGHGLYQSEVDHLIDREWARSADDILWRRSKLGLRFSADETARLQSYVLAAARQESV
ncbi:MAG TPA: FAD-dependent oxidoreductase, partial [Sphingorhabdus sp.]|nr:FAD-dependent oxidoreductase [Sphingorhabdus sp.]